MVRISLAGCLLLCCSMAAFPQLFEFNNVSRLPATVNTAAEEGMPLLSPDGKKLYFSRALYENNEGGEYGGQDIWMSELGGQGWKKATNAMGPMNNRHNNVVVGMSRDGKTLYFVNASPFQKMNGIYFSRLSGNSWGRPQLIYIPGIDNFDFIGFYVSPDQDVIFLSMRAADSRGSEDLYFSVKDIAGVWSRPKNLGATINTSGYEISPFLSEDKKRLYFASNGHKGEGDADIFYSERLYDSWETWSVPVNLGSGVNSKKFDAYFSIYGDSIAYFSSNRDSQYAELYQANVHRGRSILAQGQRYITREEWNSIVGKNVATDFVFPHRSSLLTAAQKELIFYIVNRLMLQKDVRFHLIVKEEEDSNVSRDRLKAINNHLKQSGIDPARVNEEQVFDIEKTQRGVIEVRLFR
jgi:hypothetical protein